MKTFIQYLNERHAEQYHGVDDDMPDDFNNWLVNLDTEDIIGYANFALLEAYSNPTGGEK